MHSLLEGRYTFFYYEITSRQSLENLFEKRRLNCGDMLHLLAGIQETLQSLHKYLIPADSCSSSRNTYSLCRTPKERFYAVIPREILKARFSLWQTFFSGAWITRTDRRWLSDMDCTREPVKKTAVFSVCWRSF